MLRLEGFCFAASVALVGLFLCGAEGRADTGVAVSGGDLREMISRFTIDRDALQRTYDAPLLPKRDERFRAFYEDSLRTLQAVDFASLNQEGRVDYLLLQNYLTHALRQMSIDQRHRQDMAPLLPFANRIFALDEARRRMEPPQAEKAAESLTHLTKEIGEVQQSLAAGLEAAEQSAFKPESVKAEVAKSGVAKTESVKSKTPLHAEKYVARRASLAINRLRDELRVWFSNYDGYDPQFTWWVGLPYKDADKALDEYGKFLMEKVVGVKPEDKATIVGDPVGRDALLLELTDAMIPYTPEELIALAKNEMAWCTKEMVQASRELGYGDEWHKALEHVKDMHVEPGKQPELIRQLAVEAMEYVEKHDLVTTPPLAKEIWRMEMLTPEQQLVNPFFLGGETIQVSYPTNTMTFEQRLMSMRGNNRPFARATVLHELIPGHHLQFFMAERYRAYRQVFDTPFWVEGNAFYWEMLLWDLGFPQTPEERIGMLFWRMHRCARVIFSLSFHLGQMTAPQCVDYLVEAVGHERDNAAAEVRRSFESSYSPIYQSAYMLGALQFRALHKELVDSGRMTNRVFHDIILQGNMMPVELVRARLTNQALTRDFQSSWRFYEAIRAQ